MCTTPQRTARGLGFFKCLSRAAPKSLLTGTGATGYWNMTATLDGWRHTDCFAQAYEDIDVFSNTDAELKATGRYEWVNGALLPAG